MTAGIQRHEFVLGHQPALDGLRGLAIALVVAYNWGLPGATGGYIGVDLFFVLSGFLIASILLQEWDRTGDLRLGAFYVRRACRLLPALFLVLAVYGAYLALRATPEVVAYRRPAIAAVVLYVANWYFVLMPDGFARLGPLAHTWSLAVEEQFYLLWPPVLLLVLRRRFSLRGVAVWVGIAALTSAAWRTALSLHGARPERMYAGTDTRLDALLLGCLIALALAARHEPLRTDPRYPRWLGGAALLAFLMFAVAAPWQADWMFRGGYALVGLLAAILVVSGVRDAGPFGAFFRLAPLRWLGRVSYGVYLWHFPVGTFAAQLRGGQAPEAVHLPLMLLATFAAAVPSYYLIELPMIRWGRRRFSGAREGPHP